MVIRSFHSTGAEDLFNGKNSRAARRLLPRVLWRIAGRKLDQLDSARSPEELRVPPGNRLERLTGDRADQWSLRINDQYRVCFDWPEDAPENVEIVDYH